MLLPKLLHQLPFLILGLIGCLAPVGSPGQAVQAGPDYSVPHHRRIVQFLRGGDGDYYLVMTSSGSVGRYSMFGESHLKVHRFGPDLRRKFSFNVRRNSPPWSLPATHTALPAPRGIALLGLSRQGASGPSVLTLCQPGHSGGSVECTSLGLVAGQIPNLSELHLRTSWSPDSSQVALSWRGVPTTDNSTVVLVLDRDLKPVSGPHTPLVSFQSDLQIKHFQLLGDGKILFYLKSIPDRNRPIGWGTVVWDPETGLAREVRLSSRRLVPLSWAFASRADGDWLGGWYVDVGQDSLVAGLYLGQVEAESDTLVNRTLWQIPGPLAKYLVPVFKSGEDPFSYQRILKSALVNGKDGFACWLHLQTLPQTLPEPDKRMENHCFLEFSLEKARLDWHLHPVSLPKGDEFKQVWSFQELPTGDVMWNDFSGVKKPLRPEGYRLVRYQGEPRVIDDQPTEEGRKFAITAVQHVLPDGDRGMVVVQRYRRYMRLLRLPY